MSTSNVTVSGPVDEWDLLREAAHRAGISFSAYLRQAALSRARREAWRAAPEGCAMSTLLDICLVVVREERGREART